MVSNRRQVYAIAMVWSSQLNSICNWFVGCCCSLRRHCHALQWRRNGCLGSHVSSSIEWYRNHWDYSHQINSRYFFANENNNSTNVTISFANGTSDSISERSFWNDTKWHNDFIEFFQVVSRISLQLPIVQTIFAVRLACSKCCRINAFLVFLFIEKMILPLCSPWIRG